MKWNKNAPTLFDERVIEKFLLLPKELQGEVRWLEKVKIKQFYGYTGAPFFPEKWIDEEFV
jgi:hypothetical protein